MEREEMTLGDFIQKHGYRSVTCVARLTRNTWFEDGTPDTYNNPLYVTEGRFPIEECLKHIGIDLSTPLSEFHDCSQRVMDNPGLELEYKYIGIGFSSEKPTAKDIKSWDTTDKYDVPYYDSYV